MIDSLRCLAEDLHSLCGCNQYSTVLSRTADSLEQLRAELASLRQDALNYRWLCSHTIIPCPSQWNKGVGFPADLPGLPRSGYISKDQLDAAIKEQIK
jgi:hypothetical protein